MNNLQQFVSYFTLGLDRLGNIVSVPVLSKKNIGGCYITQDIHEVARKEEVVVILFDDGELDVRDGYACHGCWKITGNIVRAPDKFGINMAIKKVKEFFNA